MDEWSVTGFVEVRELGRGGQGRVVLALHPESGTPVAIKYLFAGAETGEREVLRREARMLGRVRDPYVARLYRLVESERGAAIVMEAVDGVPLKAILAAYEALEPEAALLVLKGSLLGLAAAHAVGVVHRDYKPANVVVRADGLSKLIDFGIAVPAGRGSRAGTAHYMAPEQWRGEPASPATDVYSATCVFFECVTGRRPYPHDNRTAIMAGHLTAPVPVEQVPEPLRDLVARGMAKEAGSRPSEAAAFVAELEDVAVSAYGPDWQDRGLRALAVAAAGLASLFPLAAAGLPQGGGTADATGRTAAEGTAKGTARGTARGTAKAGRRPAAVKAVVAVAVAAAVAAGAFAYASADREDRASADPAARPSAPSGGGAPAGTGLAGDFRLAGAKIEPPGNLSEPLHKVAFYYADNEKTVKIATAKGCTGPRCDFVVRDWTIVLPKERIKRDVPLRREADGSYRSAENAPSQLELKSPRTVAGDVTGFTLILHVGTVTVTWQATRS